MSASALHAPWLLPPTQVFNHRFLAGQQISVHLEFSQRQPDLEGLAARQMPLYLLLALFGQQNQGHQDHGLLRLTGRLTAISTSGVQ